MEERTIEIKDLIGAMYRGMCDELTINHFPAYKILSLTSQSHKRIKKVEDGLMKLEEEMHEWEGEENSKDRDFD